MSDADAPEEFTAVEQALEGHLELLRAEPPAAPAALDHRIIRSARWQRTVRRPLLTIGHFAEAVRDAIRLLFMPPDHR